MGRRVSRINLYQIAYINTSNVAYRDMNVKTRKVTREILASCIKDDCTVEITIELPASYPLRIVNVASGQGFGVSENQLQKWARQIIKILSASDMTIVDTILAWKEDVDKVFEGVEPCPICFCIIQPKTRKIPKLHCRTCRKVYHPTCLYHWFQTSHNRLCPMCKQEF